MKHVIDKALVWIGIRTSLTVKSHHAYRTHGLIVIVWFATIVVLLSSIVVH